MKTFDVLKKIIDIIKQNLNINIYNTFSSKIVKLPIMENFLTVEIHSSKKEKTLITITTYAPQANGVEACKNLTKKTIDILNNSKIEHLEDVVMQNVVYNKQTRAYCQKCKVVLKESSISLHSIYFGNEEILVKQDLTLKFYRNTSVYYSQLAGAQFKDLGNALRRVEGTAVVKKEQFQRLAELILKGTKNILTVQDQKFTAILTELNRKTKDNLTFSFVEVA